MANLLMTTFPIVKCNNAEVRAIEAFYVAISVLRQTRLGQSA